MEKYSPSYVIKELQIKTMRYHHIPIKMAKTQNNDNTKWWQGYRPIGTLIHCRWEWKMVRPLFETFWQLFRKLNIGLSYDPAIVLVGIYLNELKLCPQKILHTNIYNSFIHNCQKLKAINVTFSRRINKMWYIDRKEYYWVIKKWAIKPWKNTQKP